MRNKKNIKEIAGLVIFIVLVCVSCNVDFGSRVFDIKSPSEIFIDVNKNLVFDEKEPYKLAKIQYINRNTDFEKYPLLKQLTDDEKFFLEYKAKETAEQLLKNRYVQITDSDILIRDKSYTSMLFKSKLVFDDRLETQQALLDNIKSINLDDYVILNIKNRKYHKLNCIAGRKSNKFKIVKLSDIKNSAERCRMCYVQSLKNDENKNREEKLPSVSFKKDFFETKNIKIFFIDLNKNFKPNNNCSENACKTLLKEIEKAEKSIDFAIYGINNQPKILEALINAHKRGVNIRRVYDYSDKKYYEDNDKLDKVITDYKTDEQYDKTNKSALMHNKYFIFDNKKVWTGSSNISTTDLSGFNANYTVLIDSQELAERYKKDFEQMYSGIFHKGKKSDKSGFMQLTSEIKVKPLFSPQDNIIDTEIIPLINSSKRYIYMPIFFITHKGIKDALINAYKRGVEIKVINDATNAHTNYTIHKELRNAGIKVKTENFAGKMHAKVLIADDKYSVIGSMNFTKSGSLKNDENLIIIESSQITKYMRSTFLYLWDKIPEKYEKYDPKAESLESVGSCYDGIDNDFDEKIDFDDDSCYIKKK